jgi:hypothetical protein
MFFLRQLTHNLLTFLAFVKLSITSCALARKLTLTALVTASTPSSVAAELKVTTNSSFHVISINDVYG